MEANTLGAGREGWSTNLADEPTAGLSPCAVGSQLCRGGMSMYAALTKGAAARRLLYAVNPYRDAGRPALAAMWMRGYQTMLLERFNKTPQREAYLQARAARVDGGNRYL